MKRIEIKTVVLTNVDVTEADRQALLAEAQLAMSPSNNGDIISSRTTIDVSEVSDADAQA